MAVPLRRRERGGWGTHAHRQHQIAWVSTGSSTVAGRRRHWTISPTRAVWIPSGHAHDIVNHHGRTCTACTCGPSTARSTGRSRASWPSRRWPASCSAGSATVAETVVGEASATVLLAELGRTGGRRRRCRARRRPRRRARRSAARRAGQPGLARAVGPAAGDEPEHVAPRVPRRDRADVHEWRTRVRLDAALPLLTERISVGASPAASATPAAAASSMHSNGTSVSPPAERRRPACSPGRDVER